MAEESRATDGGFLPKKFFVTSGKALSFASPLNAFDAALSRANISQCNLVQVSSTIPPEAKRVKNQWITPGTITFCVLAHMEGSSGETIGAGVGWVFGEGSDGKRYGIVAEDHGYKDARAVERSLKAKLREMAKIRGLKKLGTIFTKVVDMEVRKGSYGSVISALVYVPW